MKRMISFLILVALFSFTVLSGCGLNSTTFWVTSTDDNPDDPVSGTLRYALLHAAPYDKIKFDADVFDPDNPATIFIGREDYGENGRTFQEADLLPHIGSQQHHLTLDASNAGVILDGSRLPRDLWSSALQIVGTNGVVIKGLEITNFPGPAIGISGGSKKNIIRRNRITTNKEGLNLSSPNVSENLIWDNYIGGNLNRGITIYEGAHDNTVGPRNVIAFNGPQNSDDLIQIGYDLYGKNDGCGIYIENTAGQDSSGNLLTQNSIHNNKGNGICLVEDNQVDYFNKGGANGELRAPYILSLDVMAGTVSGISCPGCTVEVFSSPNRGEGRFFEGQATAQNDSDGTFTFEKGTRFLYDYVTVTATDENHNTSEFSRPAGLYNTDRGWLQTSNNHPAFLLLTKPSYLFADNHIGAWLDGYEHGYDDTDLVYRNGFKRIHIASLARYQENYWNTLTEIPQEVDDTITDYAEKDTTIELFLDPGSGVSHLDPFQIDVNGNNPDLVKYLDYVSLVADHFAGTQRIDYYEILNEPGYISVQTYADVVNAAAKTIRDIDPDAKITMNTLIGDWEEGYPGYSNESWRFGFNFVNGNPNWDGTFYWHIGGLLDAEVVGEDGISTHPVLQDVDGFSWHPFGGNVYSDPYYQDYPEIVQAIKSRAYANGFTGEYFGEDMLWPLYIERDWKNGPPVSLFVAAKYYTRAIVEERGLDLSVTINPNFQKPFLAPIANLGNLMAGVEPTNFPPVSIDTDEEANIRYYAFELPGFDKLAAIWTNDAVSDFDDLSYGIRTTLTMGRDVPDGHVLFIIPNSVTAIDVLLGIEQELDTEIVDGNLVIRDLMVKDYPIFLRFYYQ